MRGFAFGLGVAATLAAGEAAAQPDGPPSPAARVSLLVERFTGPVDRHCGILALQASGTGAPISASRREVTTALRCVLRARREGRRTWALWELQGIDSTVFAGLAVSGRSDVHLVRYDSMGSAGAVMTPCLRPRVTKDAQIACRNRIEPLHDADVDDILAGLARDARRAAGEHGTQAVDQARTAASAAPANGSDARVKAALVTAAQSMQRLTGAPWPACPYHHDHPLQVHDRYWVCGRDGIFVGELGKLARQPRARPLR